jgi:Fic family protein
MKYSYQLNAWPNFTWDSDHLSKLLTEVHHHQGRLLGKMENLGFKLQREATLETITLDVIKSSEIEGEILNPDEVRSSVARHLGMDIAGLIPSDRNVEGVVDMMIDATQNYHYPLSDERMFGWHAALFPTGRSSMNRIAVGRWRDNAMDDPMQVISGPMGRETVHFQAPDSHVVPGEMKTFLDWFNSENYLDPILKAAIAHLWFVTIHPFDDGNGRIARAITDLQLARADDSMQRFYSMSTQIRKERREYYAILQQTQRDLDITKWLEWFLHCLNRAILVTGETLSVIIKKAKFWEKHATTTFNARQVLMLNKLLDGIFFGKLTSSKWAMITKTSPDTAIRDINDLLNRGVISKEGAGGRSTSYVIADL